MKFKGFFLFIIFLGLTLLFDATNQNIYTRTTFLIYGNYCCYGNNERGKMPTDNLDTASMYHDYCYVHGDNDTTSNTNFRARLKSIMNNTNRLSYKNAVVAYVVFG